MSTCKTCKYWSDLVAMKPPGSWQIKALCLCADGPKHSTYTEGTETCPKQQDGKPVDS